jgi:hypothetical protein
MQQNDIYNIPLPRGPGPKKKHKKRTNMGQITRSELKRRIPHGDPKYLLGTREKPDKSDLPPFNHARERQLHSRYISALSVANSPRLPTPFLSS